MKFNVFAWQEIENEKPIEGPEGHLHVRCHPEAAVFVEVEGYEALAGYGETALKIAGPYRFRVVSGKGMRAFYDAGESSSYEPSGEKFTNIDRQPLESGSLLEVRKALREFERKKQELRRELQAERVAMRREQRQRQRQQERLEEAGEETPPVDESAE